MTKAKPAGRITVLAGTNGAGKSSIAGAALMEAGMDFFNPDKVASNLRDDNPTLSQDEANSIAWREGVRLLERAVKERREYAFETTLGGRTIPDLLQRATSSGIEVWVWYVGLRSVELHLRRVRARVARGGHDIPEPKIRERYALSVLHLIELMPSLTELAVFDNSVEADPGEGVVPQPMLVLHQKRGKIIAACDPAATPEWAKPIVVTALNLSTN